MPEHADIVMVVDPRFSGGTSAALAADVGAFSSAGLRVGLLFVESRFLDGGPDRENKVVTDLLDRPGVVNLTGASEITAKTAFFHHPLVFFHGVKEGTKISATRAVVVAHQTPFRGDGSLEYDPISTTIAIRRRFGLSPIWAPISGVCRSQLASFLPIIRLSHDDWVNVFDLDAWQSHRQAFANEPFVVGRHGRPDLLKWPDRAEDIQASLPKLPGWSVRVMGYPEELRSPHTPDHWDVLPFNAEPVSAFLDSIDVFSYFHSDRWIETFGRTVAEAALMARVCVLDRRLEPTFGDIAIYCSPEEVRSVLENLARDPAKARVLGERAATRMRAAHAHTTVLTRWQALMADPGSRVGSETANVRPHVVIRKLLGLYKRRASRNAS